VDDSGARPAAGRDDLTFLTRQGCPICDEALELVQRYARGSVEVVDVDLDLDLLERYNELVPVVLDTTGRVLATGPLSSGRVRRLVRRINR
jgi:hypothetical protein